MPTVIILSSAYAKGAFTLYSHSTAISDPGMGLKQILTFQIDCVRLFLKMIHLILFLFILTRDLREGLPFILIAGN